MKKIILSCISVLCLSVSMSAFAQGVVLKNREDSLRVGWWERKTQLGANISGSAFSENWQGGGTNNIVLGGVFGNKADRFKGKGVWTNDLQLQLGMLNNYRKQQSGGRIKESRKNLDRLFAETKYASKISPKVNWFASATLLSQLLKGVDYENDKQPIVSAFFSPAFITQGIGLEYKPVKYFVLSFGGATIRETLVLSDAVWNSEKFEGKPTIYGVERGKKSRLEGGFQGVAAYDKNLTPKINLKWRWQTFMPYNFKSMDHNVNAIASAKVNKYMNVNATLIVIFDKDQTEGLGLKPWQVNGGLNLGFAVQL